MNSKLIADIIGGLMKLEFLKGYRTYIGAAGLFGAALYRLSEGDYGQAVTDFSLALAAIGIRTKQDEPKVVTIEPGVGPVETPKAE
jgi:hypothetical protein